jgi:hypothetical protein
MTRERAHLSHISGGAGRGQQERARALLKCDLRRVCVRSADYEKICLCETNRRIKA